MISAPAFIQKHEHALVALSFAVIVALLGLHTVDDFWRGDDPAILAHMLKHPLADLFFSAAAWRELSSASLTPWLSLSFYVDYALAGLSPSVFYLHQMFSLWLVALVSTRLFSFFMKSWLAIAGTLLFLLGTPVLRISDQLMTRHYLEGLLLSLLALYFFLRYRREVKAWQLMVAVLCYLLAITAKEIYVPLGVLLILLSTGNRAQRIRQILPVVTVIAVYILWRHHMLPAVIGGYAQNSSYLSLQYWQQVLLAFCHIPGILFGSFTFYLAIPLFIVITAGTVLQRFAWLWTLMLVGMVLAPMIPLVAYPGINAADRYLLLPWFLICFAFVFHLDVLLTHLARKPFVIAPVRFAQALCLLLAALVFMQRMKTYNEEKSYYAAIDSQMRFIWENDASKAFVPGNGMTTAFWMITGLAEIKQLQDSTASSPVPVVDDIFVKESLPLYEFSGQCGCMQDISSTIPQRLARFRQARLAALNLSITNDDGLVAWHFGPYASGSYNVVSETIGSLILPPSQSGLRANIRSSVDFHLRYTSPEGWSTYSPLLKLEPNGVTLNWNRE